MVPRIFRLIFYMRRFLLQEKNKKGFYEKLIQKNNFNSCIKLTNCTSSILIKEEQNEGRDIKSKTNV